jgi:hypothetical protein
VPSPGKLRLVPPPGEGETPAQKVELRVRFEVSAGVWALIFFLFTLVVLYSEGRYR